MKKQDPLATPKLSQKVKTTKKLQDVGDFEENDNKAQSVEELLGTLLELAWLKRKFLLSTRSCTST